MKDAHRRRELGAYLRACRERTAPSAVALAATRRRRTPGLRREELAVLAGVSATWLTYLEQGREVRPSQQVLLALASALGLREAERAHLLTLAQDRRTTGAVAPPAAHLGLDAEALVAAIASPAYVTDAAYDLLAVNAAALELFTGICPTHDDDHDEADGDGTDGHEPAHPANLALWVLTHPAAPAVLLDWEVVARDLLARVRSAAARHRDDPRFPGLVAQLRAASPQADAWWRRYEVAGPHGGTKRVVHPHRGVLVLAHTALVVADHPENTLVVYAEAAPDRAGPADPQLLAPADRGHGLNHHRDGGRAEHRQSPCVVVS